MKLPSFTASMITLTLAACAATHPSVEPSAAGAAPSQEVALPTAPFEGRPRVLVDNADVKLVTVTMSPGSVMPRHSSTFPVIVQALSGSGRVGFDSGETMRVGPDALVYLAADEPHDVSADDDAPLVLLVQHMKTR